MPFRRWAPRCMQSFSVWSKSVKPSGRDATTESLLEYRLVLGIVTVCSIMAIILIGPRVSAYFTGVSVILP
jgi:hypothetical protein